MSDIDDNIDMYKHIPIDRWPDFIGYIFKYAQKKNTYTEASGIYSREAFDQETGQMTDISQQAWRHIYYFKNTMVLHSLVLGIIQ